MAAGFRLATDGRSRFGGASRRIADRFTLDDLSVLGLCGAAATAATIWTLHTWSVTYAAHGSGFTDFTKAIFNAGSQVRGGGFSHFYGGNGAILVALPAFQLMIDAVVRLVAMLGGGLPSQDLLIVHHRVLGNYVEGIAWVVPIAVGYVAGFSSLLPIDRLIRRTGARAARRVAAMALVVPAMWFMQVVWGHPDDALAVGLLVCAISGALENRWGSSAWILGIGIAVQPLVLLGVPVFLGLAGLRRWPNLLVRLAVPGMLAVSVPMLADPRDTWRQVVEQPTYPVVGHPTPWIAVVPHPLAHVVDAGWPRMLGTLLACALGWWLTQRRTPDTTTVIWSLALCLSLRCVFETVVFPYYIVPPLVMAFLLVGQVTGLRMVLVALIAAGGGALVGWHTHDHLVYWLGMVASLGSVLWLTRPPALALAPVRLPADRTDEQRWEQIVTAIGADT
ncbi:MAG: hypothetical protein ACYCU7_11495 [Acidimicrobiales bacterium]